MLRYVFSFDIFVIAHQLRYQERERAVENTASAAQHAELVERINQLNILRESNATLRAECESATKKSRELEAKLAQLSKELEPAKEHALSAQAELEATKGQMQRLEQESRTWQERNSQLLSKVIPLLFLFSPNTYFTYYKVRPSRPLGSSSSQG